MSRISHISDFSKTGLLNCYDIFGVGILPYPRVFLISVSCPILIAIFVFSSKQNFERTMEVADS